MTSRIVVPAAFTALLVAYFGYHFERLAASEPYRNAVAFVHRSEELKRVLGAPLRDGLFPTGEVDGEMGEASIGVPVRGARGRARVRITLERFDRQWRLIRAEYGPQGGGRRVLTEVDVEQLKRAQTHGARGYALYVKGEYAEALREFNLAVAGDSANAVSFYWRAWVLTNLGRTDDARADLERAVALDPDYAVAHHDLGVNYGRSGDYSRSLEHLNRAISLDPGEGMFQYSRSIALNGLGRYAEAYLGLVTACVLGYRDACGGR